MSICSLHSKIASGEAVGIGAGLARGALAAASVPYRLGSSLVEILRTGQGGARVDLPVLSIGNLTVGGTGKTPVVAMLVGQLRKKGLRPVVLSRGYKSRGETQNDEARALSRAFPDLIHLQGKDRAELAWTVSAGRMGDVIVLDDGFQYHALERDMDVCLIDATNPFGYGAVLPRGLLREPLTSLYRARPVLITRAELVGPDRLAEIRAEVLRWNEHAKIVVSEMALTRLTDVGGAPEGPATSLAGTRVVLASGLGNPEAFERSVRALGARVAQHVARADHHDWSAGDVTALVATAREAAAATVVTTTKDAVKLERLAWPDDAPPLRVVEVEARITAGADVWDKLVAEALAKR